jgi:hypothetical protein
MTALDNLLGKVIAQSESLRHYDKSLKPRLAELIPVSSRGKGEQR